ncbi:HMG box family protein [Histomonas meleagridis]|uniref:HMG box family protein n=1 Tax=Histomonas meleagridis TaxID=135588 RepID=UPI0035598FDE|nr:HMG box family protein [Histomonas meleagridis]KAH0805399.1 HMG box family protein [Histomonas meleagridis]
MEENIFSLGMVQPKTKTKRPPNGYILYCLEKRTEFRTLHPDLPNIEISRMLGNEWKSLNEVDRRPYKEKAKILQAEFKLKNPDYRYEKAREKRHAQEIALQNRNQVSSFDGLQENFQAILNLLNASLGQQNHPMANSNVTQSISEPHISDFHPFGDFFDQR